MDGYEFERELVATLVYLIEREGMKHEPTVEMAWKGRKDAGPAWQKIRNKVPPQKLTVRDAYDLTRTMGWSFAEICGIVQGRMLDRKPLPQGEKQLPQGENQLLLEGERGRPSKAREK